MHKQFWIRASVGLFSVNLIASILLTLYVKVSLDASRVRSEQLVSSLILLQKDIKLNQVEMLHIIKILNKPKESK
jgi:uncharacterized membrane protein